MGYGTYSEVYFARHLTNHKLIKIGETSNARRRNNQLIKNESFEILADMNIGGDVADRLFVESYLRNKIQASKRALRHGLDYFECSSEGDAEWVYSQFYYWVFEANQILWQMKNSREDFQFSIKCTKEKTENYLSFLNDLYRPFGYKCTALHIADDALFIFRR